MIKLVYKNKKKLYTYLQVSKSYLKIIHANQRITRLGPKIRIRDVKKKKCNNVYNGATTPLANLLSCIFQPKLLQYKKSTSVRTRKNYMKFN